MFAWGRDICEESMSVYVNGMRIAYDCTHDGGRERGSDCLAEEAVGSFFSFFFFGLRKCSGCPVMR